MFDSDWTRVDNTPLGAAARIRYFLDHEDTLDEYFDGYDPELYKSYLKPELKMPESKIKDKILKEV